MDIRVKQRIVGAVVLVALAIVFIPMFLHGAKLESLSTNASKQTVNTIEITSPPAVSISAAPTPASPISASESVSSKVTPDKTEAIVFDQSKVLMPATKPTTNSNRLAFGNDKLSAAMVLPESTTPKPAKSKIAAAKKSLTTVAKKPVTTPAPITVASSDEDVQQQTKNNKPAAPKAVAISQLVDLDAQVKAAQATQVASTTTTVAKASVDAKAGAWIVQLGIFSNTVNAKKLTAQLRAKGFAVKNENITTAKGKAIRVYLGPQKQRMQAQTMQAKLKNLWHVKSVIVALDSSSLTKQDTL